MVPSTSAASLRISSDFASRKGASKGTASADGFSLNSLQIWLKGLKLAAAPRSGRSSYLAPLYRCIFFHGGGPATHRCLIA